MSVWILRFLSTIAIVLTFLPLLPTGFWFVRGWDLPRFQLAVVLLALIVGAVALRASFKSKPELVVWLTMLSVAGIWQATHVIQFTPLWTKEVKSATVDQNALRFLVVNLDYESGSILQVSDEVLAIDPDVLILIEVDEDWRAGLSRVRSEYEFAHEEIRGEGLGMSIWSKLPLRNSRTRFLVEDRRPTIWTELVVEDAVVNLVAVHPTPPGLQDSTGEDRRNSRVRDAELVLIAKEIADRKSESWIVAGDFNDVAWSHTTRLFRRLSGLRDPRVGRSFMGTFPAGYPFLRVPIDHVFVSDAFAVANLDRHKITGSDHFGVSASLVLETPAAGVTPEPKGDDQADAAEIVDEGKRDAEERDLSPDP